MPHEVSWAVRGTEIPLNSPIVMGILNATPDSFSDGGSYVDLDSAVQAGLGMVSDGAVIVDVGGESTRPGASLVPLDDELERVVSLVAALSSEGVLVSVDTTKPQVALAAVEAGAVVVNDITGLESPQMRDVCAEAGVGVVLMHMQGTPRTMQRNPVYGDVVAEVTEYLSGRAAEAELSGIPRDAIVIDPGIGFGKSFEHNIDLMTHLEIFGETGYPVLVGASRKGFLGEILEPVRGTTVGGQRDGATAATVALAVMAGARVLRVHNVPLAVDVALTAKAMVRQDDGKEANRT